ncbi:hypothetical protein [Schaalia odontolytica]|uniref:hypothetical protein n=1 Tax=Schaalia odontolytica TaxID=1660 RepID=UPI00210E869E|nr:hypothetical protein [Schaalia odontolytica]MCQ5281653.1 hypothetical protein [Schaalia odontolytica]
MATLKPTTPLLAPNKGPLKPASPLLTPKQGSLETGIASAPEKRAKNAHFAPAKAMAVSIPHEHERAKAMAVSDNRTPGRQGQTAVPVGGGGAWPGDQWTADVTNVVKPTRFKSPRENPCYKRRQSKPKNRHFQRKSPRIDDVCNNGAESHTKNTLD